MGFYVIIRGPLGIGKSTLSEHVAKKLDGVHMPVDRILDEFSLTRDREEGYISQKSFIAANTIAAERAQSFLRKGKPVVFDGNFYWKSQIDDLVSRLPYPHHVITLRAPLETCIARDRARTKTHGADAARAVYAKSTSFDCGDVVDTDNKSVSQTLAEILTRIRNSD